MQKKLDTLMNKVDKLQAQYTDALASNNPEAALKALAGLADVNAQLDEMDK